MLEAKERFIKVATGALHAFALHPYLYLLSTGLEAIILATCQKEVITEVSLVSVTVVQVVPMHQV